MLKHIPLILLLTLSACSDKSSSPTTPTPAPVAQATSAPATPSRANIRGSVLRRVLLTSGEGNVLAFEFRLVESGGLGAHIDFVRYELYNREGRFLERNEFGAGAIRRDLDTNRIEANETRQFTVAMLMRQTIKLHQIVNITIGITDVKGNDHSLNIRFPIVRASQDIPRMLTSKGAS